MRFIALKNFDWTEKNHVLAHYVKGMGYSARKGAQWDALRAKLPEWEKAGNIVIEPAPIASQVEGKG